MREGGTPADLTHLLRRDDGPPGLRRYVAQMQRPTDPDLVERVAIWTAAHLG